MNEIEKKAHALVNEVAAERGETPYYKIFRNEFNIAEALCRAIEQHEAYKQDVSDTPTGLDNKNFIRQPNWAWIAGTVYYVPYECALPLARVGYSRRTS